MRVDGKYRIESWPRQFISRQGAKHNTSQLWLIYKNSSAGAAIFRRVLLFKQCISQRKWKLVKSKKLNVNMSNRPRHLVLQLWTMLDYSLLVQYQSVWSKIWVSFRWYEMKPNWRVCKYVSIWKISVVHFSFVWKVTNTEKR